MLSKSNDEFFLSPTNDNPVLHGPDSLEFSYYFGDIISLLQEH